MAFREVQADPSDKKGHRYLKLSAPGEAITATYVKRFDEDGQFGRQTLVMLEEAQEDGTTALWALRENADLRSKIKAAKPGDIVRITYLGDGEAVTLRNGERGNPSRMYRVEIEDGTDEPVEAKQAPKAPPRQQPQAKRQREEDIPF
jgi:hypothetical protein